MFSLVALFTVFLGLVGILVLYDQCQRQRRRRRRRGEQSHEANLSVLTDWLEERGHTLPSTAAVIEILNRVVKRELKSEDWVTLRVTGLLPGTELPQFTVLTILQQTTQHIEFQLAMEWPMCLPGVGVALVRGGGGEEEEEVMCELQVDWMHGEATVRLADSSSGLSLGYKHSCTPQMALSCLVTTEGVEQSEEMASHVAHTLQLIFYQMKLTNELLPQLEETSNDQLSLNSLQENHVTSTATPTLSMYQNHTGPTGHHDDRPSEASSRDITPPSTSQHGELGEGGEGGEGGEEGRRGGGERREMDDECRGQVVAHLVSRKLWSRNAVSTGEREERESGEKREGGEEREGGGAARSEEDSATETKPGSKEDEPPPANEPSPHPPLFFITDNAKTTPTSDTTDTPPSSLAAHKHTSSPPQRSKSMSSWRRSPSYEKLQEFTLPSVQERGVVSEGEGEGNEAAPGGRPQRRQTQSVVEMRRGEGEVGRGEAQRRRVGEGEMGEGDMGRGEAQRWRKGEVDNLTQPILSPDRQKRLTLSMSGSAYSVQSGEEEMYPSMLVFELSDSRRTRHIVALSAAHASKLRKRLTHCRKLHIYNDHIFVATHLRQRFYCHVCKKKIIGFMGKQGYVCRDCNMVVHKRCHYKTEGLCTNSKLSSMNLIYPDSVSTISGL